MLKKILKIDLVLISSVILLTAVGLVLLYSISFGGSYKTEGMSLFAKQSIFALVGFLFMLIFLKTDYHYLKSYSVIIYLI